MFCREFDLLFFFFSLRGKKRKMSFLPDLVVSGAENSYFSLSTCFSLANQCCVRSQAITHQMKRAGLTARVWVVTGWILQTSVWTPVCWTWSLWSAYLYFCYTGCIFAASLGSKHFQFIYFRKLPAFYLTFYIRCLSACQTAVLSVFYVHRKWSGPSYASSIVYYCCINKVCPVEAALRQSSN